MFKDEDKKYLITDWIRTQLVNSGQKSLVVGISGGVDSALVSALCVDTMCPVHLVTLPIGKGPSARALNHMGAMAKRAKDLNAQHKKTFQEMTDIPVGDGLSILTCQTLNLTCQARDLTEAYEVFRKTMDITDPLALANLQSRLRMAALYAVANTRRGLVVGTGNKIEDQAIGFFTKGGDGMVDISPIGDLMKSEVRSLARHMGVCDQIVNAPPEDGLWEDGRTDEDQIGASYDELEWAYNRWMDADTPAPEGVSEKRQKEVMDILKKRHGANRHKMQMPPVFPISHMRKGRG